MKKEEIFQALEKHAERIRSFGVRSLALFGSGARDEFSIDSDLDFIVDFQATTFDNYMDLKIFLEDLFGTSIDLVIKNDIKPQLRDRIIEEMVDVPGI